jgi:hypothetical protein
MGSSFIRIARALAGGLAVVALLASVAVAADTKPAVKIAVRSFVAKGVDPSIAGVLETSFCSALGSESLDVICPEEIKAIISMKQSQLGFGSCDDDETCMKNIAKATEATRVVTGEVSKLGELYIVSVALLDAETSKVIARASDKSSKVEDLLEKVTGLAKKIAAQK